MSLAEFSRANAVSDSSRRAARVAGRAPEAVAQWRPSTTAKDAEPKAATTQLAVRFPASVLSGINEFVASYGQADRTAVIREATIIGLEVLRGRAELNKKDKS